MPSAVIANWSVITGNDVAHHLKLGHVDDINTAVGAVAHIKHGFVGAPLHVAGAPPGLDILDHLEGLAVENRDRVVFFVTYKEITRALGQQLSGHGRRD